MIATSISIRPTDFGILAEYRLDPPIEFIVHDYDLGDVIETAEVVSVSESKLINETAVFADDEIHALVGVLDHRKAIESLGYTIE